MRKFLSMVTGIKILAALLLAICFTSALFAEPIPDIKANGSDGPITLGTDDALSVTVSLNPGAMKEKMLTGGWQR